VHGEIFESGKKKLRFQKHPHTCGRGLGDVMQKNHINNAGLKNMLDFFTLLHL